MRSIAKSHMRVQAQAGGGAPVRVPLGLKSSPSRVTQRVLTSLLKARDLAVAASCRRSMAALRLQRHLLHEHQSSGLPCREAAGAEINLPPLRSVSSCRSAASEMLIWPCLAQRCITGTVHVSSQQDLTGHWW